MQNYNWGTWFFWDIYPMKVTFDGPNKLILINEGVTSLNVLIDLYSNWKEWLSWETNAKFLAALRVVGGDTTQAPETLDATFFLINGWQIKPYPGSYQLIVDGNIYHDDGLDLYVPADVIENIPNNISISNTVSTIVRLLTVSGSGGGGSSFEGTASLIPDQAAQLTNIENMLNEVWLIHGLDSGSNMVVSPTIRLAGEVTQSILFFSGSGTSVITRI